MTENESDPTQNPPSRRGSLATSPSNETAGTSPPGPPLRRALPPPPPPGPRKPMSPGTSHRTSYIIPAAQHSAPLDVKFHVSVEPARTAYEPTPNLPPLPVEPSPTTVEKANVVVMPVPTPQSEPEPLPDYSYRSPEAVVEHIEDSWTSSLPPGVLAEHLDESDGGWGGSGEHKRRANTPAQPGMMDVDTPDLHPFYTPERPQVGPGVMVRRWLSTIHPHALYRPVIKDLPKPPPSKTPPVRRASLASEEAGPSDPVPEPPVLPRSLTEDEVLDSLPGGKENHQDWYFCPDCWGWYHITKYDGVDPKTQTMEQWEATTSFSTPEEREEARGAFQKEASRLRDMISSRGMGENKDIHFHAFENLMPSTTETRIERVKVEGHVDKFVHLEVDESPDRFKTFPKPVENAKLWVSCSSDHWVFVDNAPVPGQLPHALVREFTMEKQGNPPPGRKPQESAADAWNLVVTMLQNPLFRGNRGFIKMSNATFQTKIGATLISSHLMYQIGFACSDEPGEGYTVGPFQQNDKVTEEKVKQMDHYMARTWVEVCLALQSFQRNHGLSPSSEYIGAVHLQEELSDWLNEGLIPELSIKFETKPFGHHLEVLGVKEDDITNTVAAAYDMQVADDFTNVSKYFGALEKLSHAHVPNVETLQIKVATERSLDRYTTDDLDNAYSRIGVTSNYIEGLMVDREDIPNDHILDMHRQAMDAASDVGARSEISHALGLIGKERNDPVMSQLARNGGVYLSLDQAYKEFSISREAGVDDEMLIMQYDTWIQDRPSRAEHYRMALSIIANAPGEERPLLQAYLEGKDVSEFQPPARRDIPTGLRNIGNTCYLNSVLQFLYAIKPVRDAVMAFELAPPSASDGEETEKEMEKRVKIESSRRFVGLLCDLFNEMYSTSTKAVVPKEELARLAILPVDLIGERKEAAMPPPAKNRVTIDSLPIALSPDSDTVSSGAATAANSRADSPTPMSPRLSDTPPERGQSILGKRASHDRDSAFGGSEERLRRLTSSSSESDLIELDSEQTSPVPTEGDMSPLPREGSELPNTGLSQLGIASPQAEVGSLSAEREISAPEVESTEGTPGPVPPTVGPPPLPPRREEQNRRHSMALVAAEKFGLQQDAAEILINVLAQLEYAFEIPSLVDSVPTPNFISSLFSAKFRQQMLLQSADGAVVESHPPVESVFVHPIIGVEEDGKDLYDCLAELYLGGAEIEYEGKKGFKMDLIDELPPMLYIQMRRSQYDYAKRSQTKTNTHIPFGRTLVMDRFLAGAVAGKRQQSISLTREVMAMRTRRHELKNHKPMPIPDTFRFVREALSANTTISALGITRESSTDLASMASDLSEDILDELEVMATDATEEIDALEDKLRAAKTALETLWGDSHEVEYELVSVFVHGGTGTGGHYWTYQANLPIDGNKFFYYSDEVVKEVEPDEVFADKSAKGVSPALLCYVRKDRNLVDTLHRDAGESPAAGLVD